MANGANLAMQTAGMRILFSAIILFSLIDLNSVNASSSAANLQTGASEAVPQGECHGTGEERQVLCEASKRKDESIEQVIAEDETVRISHDSSPPREGRDVWSAAYEQWIEGNGAKAGGRQKGVARALEEARKRFGEKTPDSAKGVPFADMPALDDDELAQITAASHQLAIEGMADEDVIAILDTVDTLCASGDNGRQLEATGGVPHILRNVKHDAPSVADKAVRTLASCAQNNPPVVESAVKSYGAIAVLVRVAQRAGGNIELQAAVMRALVSLSGAIDAPLAFAELEGLVVQIILRGVEQNASDRDGRRCVTRAYVLAEQCLAQNHSRWKKALADTKLVGLAETALKSTDVDIREGAARVLASLR